MTRYEISQTKKTLEDAGIDLNLVTVDPQKYWTLALGDGGKICFHESTYAEVDLPPDGWDLSRYNADGSIAWEDDWIEDSELACFLARMVAEAA